MELAAFWIACVVLSAVVAASKGRSIFGWLILGIFFGFFALIAVGFMPSLKRDPMAPTPETHVRCPDCRELVFMDAVKCKHCGATLIPSKPEPSNAELLGRKLGSKFASKQ
jgi:hypothetical protein